MATINYIPERIQTKSVMKRVIDYCSQEKKTVDPETGIRYLSGINCDPNDAYNDFNNTKDIFKKNLGTQFYHYDQSFNPNEHVTPKTVHEIAREFAEKAWPGHEVLVATHLDAEHPHSHFVINAVSFETGLKLRQSPNTLKELRNLSDEICKNHGLSVLLPYEETKLKRRSAREYRASKRWKSWKDMLRSTICSAMSRARTKEDFIRAMELYGYQVTWTPDRKYITYTCPSGKKCRDNRLGKEMFLKENMEMELKIRQENIPFPLPVTGWEKLRGQLMKMKLNEWESLGIASELAGFVASFVPYSDEEDPEEIEREIEARYDLDNLGAAIGGSIGMLLLIQEISKARHEILKEYSKLTEEEEPDVDDDEDEGQGFYMQM